MDFALLSDGKSCVLGWGAYESSQEPLKNAFYINNFGLKAKSPWYSFEHVERFNIAASDIEKEPFSSALESLPFSTDWNMGDYEVFRENFQEAMEALQSGEIRKTLLSVCDWSDRSEASLGSKFKSLPSMPFYFYAYNFGAEGAWGLSPEILFEHDAKKKTLKSMALAGTFTNQVEERHRPEHEAVKDFFSALAKDFNCLIHFYEIQPSEYGRIKHLKSEVLFEKIPDKNLNEWIKEFHPTPALGILPRNEKNMSFLSELRSEVPSHFGAPFGFLDESICRMIVMIRGVFFNKEKLFRPIGVGVTSATHLEAEWKEISQKRFAMEDLWQQLT